MDDEVHLVKILQFTLEHAGFSVVTAYDGREALEKARSEKPDIVILDLMLPVIDGYKVCNNIKNDPDFQETPVIILSARDFKNEKIEDEILADVLMEKPFDTEKLLSTMDEQLQIASTKKRS